MVSMWCPGASIQHAPSDAGSMMGGAKKVVWHTTENDPNRASASSVAAFLRSSGNDVHIVWNPVSGEIVQAIPANRGGKGLKNAAGGVQTNRGGTYVVQIEVVGQAVHPFTDGPCKNLNKILSWLDGLGISPTWPNGSPKPYPASYGADNGTRSTFGWSKSGHFGHSQVPENLHGDPGAVNTKKLTAYPGVSSQGVVPPKPVKDPVLHSGSTGQKVKDVQHGLNILGNHLVEDGNYGASTVTIVKKFQTNRKMPATGVFDQKAWDALRRSIMNVREGKPAY